MPLLLSMSEARQVLPKLLGALVDESFLPNMAAAEATYIQPLTGPGLLADLQAKYNAGNLSPEQGKLVSFIQLYALAQGLLDELIAHHVLLTAEGVRTADTGNMPKAVGWEYKRLEVYLQERALAGKEALLQELWVQKPALWTASDAYRQYQRLLIRGGVEFGCFYYLHHPARNYQAMSALMADAQERYLEEQLGLQLLQYFLHQEVAVATETEALRLLKKALAFYTVMLSCQHLQVRMSDGGFTVISFMGGDKDGEDAGRSSADAETIRRVEKRCESEGLIYLGKAKTELTAVRKAITGTNSFTTAFDAGPLFRRLDPLPGTMGNERRKIFRF